ncbi:RIP metalloprotease RseP [uncultured Selenomonas sp.]|uniref:RIP metalloprotease RseP n=1 Tax=uncultured Selenomonas sp. TaxID=159275 RepID=UPI0028D5ED74|nr:RIP metalloprotease RseP [uncultured Selenomonas sp.]
MLEKVAATIFVFGLLVFVHELGHFITAKLTGMRVDEFAIGFGPRLVGFRYGETLYTIRIVPLGGFNDIAGMNPEDNDAGERGYCRKPILSRMVVILAGSAMNLILPVFLFFGIFFFSGIQTPNPAPVLGTVLADNPAAKAGLAAGDRILAIDGKPVGTWQELVDAIRANHGNVPLQMQVARAEQSLTVSVTPRYDASHNRGYIGIVNAYDSTYPGFLQSVSMAFERTWAIISMMLDALYRIILELSGTELAGPIGVAQMAGEVAEMGIVPLLNFAALLSLNLAIINLMPVPALDGGHFLTLCIEAVRGKPLSPRIMRYVQNAGVGLIVLLMLLAMKNDVVRIFAGG